MKCVSEWLGHGDTHTTMNIYAHVTNETKQSMANYLGGLLSSEPSNDESEKDFSQEDAVEKTEKKLIHFPAVSF